MTVCRECKINLDLTNCAPSFLEYGIHICRKCNQIQIKNRTRKQRAEALNRLGGQCKCCGITDMTLLSVDHINGGGHQESKKLRGKSFNKALLKMPLEQLLDKYRCLCFNCNYSIGFWGECAHKLSEYDGRPLLIGDKANKYNLPPEEYKIRKNNLHQIARLKSKLETILAYGNECVKCKESHPLFITLDHINNNGHIERGRGDEFYRHLRSLGYPGQNTQIQLLCHNCNAYKEYTLNRIQKSQIIISTQ